MLEYLPQAYWHFQYMYECFRVHQYTHIYDGIHRHLGFFHKNKSQMIPCVSLFYLFSVTSFYANRASFFHLSQQRVKIYGK